jgi:iron complex outermembrane receptor protein
MTSFIPARLQMKVQQLFFVILTLSIISAIPKAKAQNIILTGTVKTADDKPADNVTILIPSINRSSMTNNRGEYKLGKLQAGTYQVIARSVGLQSQEKIVTLVLGQNNNLSFTLKETSGQLDAVDILAAKTNKFANKKTDYVARMRISNLENPQVYTSVSKELISEQLVVDFKETLRNVPGVVPNNNPAGGTGGTIRGFTTSTTVRNGLAVQSYQTDPINIERVEVIKGPSGTLFGSSIVNFGGLINQVTKKPLDTLKGEIGLTIGEYELSRLTADVNMPLNADKSALFRINAAAHKENSFQNYGFKKMYTFAPSFSYKVDEKLSFLVEAELNKTNRSTIAYYQNLQNTTYRNFRDIPVPFENALTGSNLDAQLSSTNIFAEGKYKISEHWTSTTSVAYGENQIDHSSQVYPQWTANNKFNRSIFNYGPRIFTSLNGQQNFNGDVKVAGIRNRLLVGVNFYTFKSFLRFTNVGVYDAVDLTTSAVIPGINREKVDAIIATKPQSNTENKQGSYSAYASDVINVTDALMAMLSLRVDRFENAAPVAEGIKASTGAYNQTAFSPKLGLVYQVLKDQISIFGNYMNGFQNVAPVTQVTGVVDIFKPRQANQWEGGVKFEIFNKKLNATFSYYDIKISNDTRLDANNISVQDATSKSKGFEAEFIANPFEGLNVVAGYAKSSYRITNADVSVIGKYQAQTPTEFVNFWASYKFRGALKDLGAGFGGNYVSDSYFDAANLIVIPHYTVLNASVFYDKPKWRLGLKVNNLTNEKYWTNYGIPEMVRQYLANITFKF